MQDKLGRHAIRLGEVPSAGVDGAGAAAARKVFWSG